MNFPFLPSSAAAKLAAAGTLFLGMAAAFAQQQPDPRIVDLTQLLGNLRTIGQHPEQELRPMEPPLYELDTHNCLVHLSAPPGKDWSVANAVAGQPELNTRFFLSQHALLLGIQSPAAGFQLVATEQQPERSWVRLQQTYAGLPVFAAEIIAQVSDHDGTRVRKEGAPPCGIADADAVYESIGDAYNFYMHFHGRDSVDGKGQKIMATVRYPYSGGSCWNSCEEWYDHEVQTRLLGKKANFRGLYLALHRAALNLGWSGSDRNNLLRACWAVGFAWPRELYVDGSCSCWSYGPLGGVKDCPPTCTGPAPWPTVTEGAFWIYPGDTLFIRAGSYNESLNINWTLELRSYHGTATIGR